MVDFYSSINIKRSAKKTSNKILKPVEKVRFNFINGSFIHMENSF